MCAVSDIQAVVAIGAPALGGGGGGADMGGGADAGVHPGRVVQGGVEEAVGNCELAADGAVTEGQICGRADSLPLPSSTPLLPPRTEGALPPSLAAAATPPAPPRSSCYSLIYLAPLLPCRGCPPSPARLDMART